jgi:hypothetical protein
MTKYTKDQIELKNYIVKFNVKSQFKTVTDLDHWADYGIYNVTDYEKYQLTCTIKEASYDCGSKVRVDFNDYTLQELKDMCDYYCDQAHKAKIVKEKLQKDNASNFYLRIKEVCKLGASNYRTAIRWILEADELEHDFAYEGGYLVWEYNLAYKHKKLFKTAGVA